MSIQINRTDFNQGGPSSFGLRSDESKTPGTPQFSLADTVVLRGGDRKTCGAVTIDDRIVHCPKANMDFGRGFRDQHPSVGDLLVASSMPGVAMRGSDGNQLTGTVIGKALEPYSGSGKSLIRMLVLKE